LKGFSIFSGIGGFELGFQRAGVPVQWIGASEIDRFASQIYRKHFSHPNYGDIRNIDFKTLPDFDLLVGGFPCQAYSTAGRRGGFKDPRGAIFFKVIELLRHKQPRFFLLENVKGLLSHRRGTTFATVLQALGSLGYGVEWQVCNSQDLGVPQHRERILLAGVLGGFRSRPLFPFVHAGRRVAGEKRSETLMPFSPVRTPRKTKILPGNRRFKEAGEPMFTLCTGDRMGIFDGETVRLLTPVECERLQGFPDHWTQWGLRPDGTKVVMSDTQRYKCLGNAVTVNVVAAIAGRMFCLGRENGLVG